HALWTLEGLGALKVETVKNLMKDTSPAIRIQALRASETLYKYGEKSLAENYRTMALDADPSVAIQAIQSAYILKIEDADKLLKSSQQSNKTKGVQLVTTQLLEREEEAKKLASTKYSPEEQVLFAKGKTIFDSYCSTCHGVKGLGTPTGSGDLIAPAFSGSPRITGHPEYAVKTLLHGLTGAIEGKEYEGVMIAMNTNDDQWIASVVSYIRNEFGNQGSFVDADFVAQLRKETEARKSNYNYDELVGEIPKALFPQDTWKVTASSTALQGVGSTKDPSYAFTFKGWKTETPQEPGMWFQVELPKEQNLAEIQFDSGDEQFPLKYTVSVSADGSKWTEVATGVGEKGINTARLNARESAKFVRIQAAEKGEQPWAMKKLTIYAR